MLFTRTKTTMVAPENALPGRESPMPVPARHDVLGNALTPPFPEGFQTVIVGHGLLLGRRAPLLAAARRVDDRRRLRGRPHAEPDLRGGLQRPHGPHRGRPRRLRPRAGRPRGASCAPSGRGTTPPRACARATTSARSTAPRLYWTDPSQQAVIEATRDAYQGRSRPPIAARSPRRSAPRRRSTTPRTTTSSTWRRTRTATAASAAPACPARSAPASRSRPDPRSQPRDAPTVARGGCDLRLCVSRRSMSEPYSTT